MIFELGLLASTVGIALLAPTIAVIAFVRYRNREAAALGDQAELAVRLRSLADGDAVRLAAVDEFETSIYRRLFYSSTVGPKIISAAWALLGMITAGLAGLVIAEAEGLLATICLVVALVLAVGFGLAAIGFAIRALLHAATTPRVSLVESYLEAEAGTEDEVEAETDPESAPAETGPAENK